jgi:hypothetical protein
MGWSQFQFAISNFEIFPSSVVRCPLSVVCRLFALCAMLFAVAGLGTELFNNFLYP